VDYRLHPNRKQAEFLREHILGEDGTVLTLKLARSDSRGFATNIRGPFDLVEYEFEGHRETVIDAAWAGPQESRAHLHCCWSEARFAKLAQTNDAVKQNIKYYWQVAFFASEQDAREYVPTTTYIPDEKPDPRLFWFYLESEMHKAVRNLPENEIISIAE